MKRPAQMARYTATTHRAAHTACAIEPSRCKVRTEAAIVPTAAAIVNAIRDLYTQQPVSTNIWIALAWCVGILIVAYALAMATYHRKIA